MRVMLYTDVLDCGGKERQVTEIAKGLVRAGACRVFEVLVVVMERAGFYDPILEAAGIRIARLVRRWRWDPFIPISLRKIIRDFDPDIIHTFSPMTSFYTSLTPRGGQARFVENSTQNAFRPRSWMEKAIHAIAFRAADQVVGNSFAGLEAKEAPRRKAAVLYNGFDFKRIQGLPEADAVQIGRASCRERVLRLV